jgi:pimeloyl-ACP methyl ester carboxylesterase
MMRRGPRPAIYLGRPCYFGTAGTPPCTPADWTHGRFGPAVVRSMRTGLERALALRAPGFTRINLVGYSGGGALATLLAPGTREACALVTVASPLDIDEWARLRSYAPLRGSENPARLFPLPARLSQLHLRGAKDVEVAPDNAATALGGNPGARVHLVAAAGHDFDWPGVWVDLLTGREPGFPETCR